MGKRVVVRRWVPGVLSLLLTCAVCPPVGAAPQRAERAYRKALWRLARARSLYVKVRDQRTGHDTEYWYLRPNRFRIRYHDGGSTFCDGRRLVRIAATGGRASAAAPASFPEDARVLGFSAFYDSDPSAGDLRGQLLFDLGGRRRRAYWVKTTEAAIVLGQELLDPSTMLPVGHRTTEYDQVAVDLYFPVVKLNPALRESAFRPPAAPAPAGAR